ncbi:hypothetical protein LCGC14_1569050, partial [marine sediment metagenome]|nr:hypothetical protein [Pricia sp.]
MKDKNLAFSAMLISVTFFVVIGFMAYYPILQYMGVDSRVFDIVHNYLLRFDALQRPLQGRGMLLMCILGAVMLYSPRKKEDSTLASGLLYFCSGGMLLLITGHFRVSDIGLFWVSVTLYCLGFLFSVSGAVHLFQVTEYGNAADKDPFNDENETFRQTEKRTDTEHSVNIPYEYRYKGRMRKGWINFVNLFRALLIIGTPGSGKSFALIEEIIEQMVEKNFTLLIYDFKFDTLSKIAYNYWRRKKERSTDPKELSGMPEFYTLSFDDIERSHRCNPIDPYLMANQT